MMPDMSRDLSESLSDRSLRTLGLGRVVLLGFVVLAAFEIGRLISGALIGPWLSEVVLGDRTPVMIGGEFNLPRVGIEVLSIVLGTALAALMVTPIVRILGRR